MWTQWMNVPSINWAPMLLHRWVTSKGSCKHSTNAQWTSIMIQGGVKTVCIKFKLKAIEQMCRFEEEIEENKIKRNKTFCFVNARLMKCRMSSTKYTVEIYFRMHSILSNQPYSRMWSVECKGWLVWETPIHTTAPMWLWNLSQNICTHTRTHDCRQVPRYL